MNLSLSLCASFSKYIVTFDYYCSVSIGIMLVVKNSSFVPIDPNTCPQRSISGDGARCPKEWRQRPQPAVARCANGVSAGDPRHDGMRCLEERWWLQLLAPRCRCRRGLLGHGHLASYGAPPSLDVPQSDLPCKLCFGVFVPMRS